MQLHPNWSARDNYAKHKKKRRKRDKVRDGGSKKSNLIHRNCRLMFLWFFKIVYMSYFCQGIFLFCILFIFKSMMKSAFLFWRNVFSVFWNSFWITFYFKSYNFASLHACLYFSYNFETSLYIWFFLNDVRYLSSIFFNFEIKCISSCMYIF